MAWRTTEADVRTMVETDSAIDLSPFIDMASALTDRVAAKDTDAELSATMLVQIELLLAAHFYSLRDQRFQSKNTGRAGGSFQGQAGKGLESTDYGSNAIALDVTGYLAQLTLAKRPKIGLTWLGRAPSEQTDYEDRD